MRVAFYAPLKAPTHPVPSGDRRMARLLSTALARGGHRVELASRLRTWDGRGDRQRQTRLRDISTRLAERLLRRYRARPPNDRPELWFTYHLYHKAPDWLGPLVSGALEIPYVLAEASFAPKQAGGRWRIGHEAAAAAIAQANAIVALNEVDVPCVEPLLATGAQVVRLKPFLDLDDLPPACASVRAQLVAQHNLDPGVPWLLAVAMMRNDQKRESYQVLGGALAELSDQPWHLVVAGDGAARDQVCEALGQAGPGRFTLLGEMAPGALASIYAACDIFVWPAVREAYGMALLEAQAAGMPAVVGRSGAVPEIVADGTTGFLPPVGDQGAFSTALRTLLLEPSRRRAMGVAARERIRCNHDIGGAASVLDELLGSLTTRPAT